jgi:MFS transporter, DHA2 family, multidrug resistance protein
MLFEFRQRRLTSPLLDLRLFGTRTFSVTLGIMLLGTVTMGGIFLFVTLYLQMVEGLSPLQAGLWLVPSALGVGADTMLAPAIARRIRPAYVIAAGLAIVAVGCLLLKHMAATKGERSVPGRICLVRVAQGACTVWRPWCSSTLKLVTVSQSGLGPGAPS